MNNTHKKLLSIISAIVVCVFACGCKANVEPDLSDFAVTLKMPQEEISVGKQFEVLARFVNLTNETYPIIHSGNENKSSMLHVIYYRDDEDKKHRGLVDNAVSGHEIKAKEVISQLQKITIQEKGKYQFIACAHFSIGEKSFIIESKIIEVTVK